jgi:LDH2 family malate/lactate/ureidoglycolate dehydrogenase
LYPGEVELRKEQERRRHGIPLAAETVRKLQAELDLAKLDMRLESLALDATSGA